MRHQNRQRSSRFRALGVTAGFVLGVLLATGFPAFAQSAAAADPLRRSVKDLKLNVSTNGRYLVDQDGRPVAACLKAHD